MMVMILLACGGEAPSGDTRGPAPSPPSDTASPPGCDLADYSGTAVYLDQRVQASFVGERHDAWAGHAVACLARDDAGPGTTTGLWAVAAPEFDDDGKVGGSVFVFQGVGELAREDAVHTVDGADGENDRVGEGGIDMLSWYGAPAVLGASSVSYRDHTNNGLAFLSSMGTKSPVARDIGESDLLLLGETGPWGGGGQLAQLLPLPDLDGDGVADFAVVHDGQRYLDLYLGGTAPEAMASRTPDRRFDRDQGAYRAAIGDLNDDGQPDLVHHLLLDGVLSIAMSFGPLLEVDASEGLQADAMVQGPMEHGVVRDGPGHFSLVADLNADGVDDLVVNTRRVEEDDRGQGEDFIHAFFGPFAQGTTRTFDEADVSFLQAGERSELSVKEVADHDGDGYEDLVLVQRLGNEATACATLRIVPGPITAGAYTAEDAQFTYVGAPGSHVASDVAACDLDGDGDEELVIGNRSWEGTGRAIVVEGGDLQE